MRREVSYVVKLIDATKAGISSVRQNLGQLSAEGKGLTGKLSAGFRSVAKAIGGKVGLTAMVTAAALAMRKFRKATAEALETAFGFETSEAHFRNLGDSAEDAHRRVEDLIEFARMNPFEFEGVEKASKTLERLTKGKLGDVDKNFTRIGDAAAKAEIPIESMATLIGTFYARASRGEDVSGALKRLEDLGVISGKTRVRIERMATSGKTADAQFRVLSDGLSGTEGSMNVLNDTGDELKKKLSETWTQAAKKYGDAMTDDAKQSTEDMIDVAERLRDSGAFEAWGIAVSAIFNTVKQAAVDLASFLTSVLEKTIELGGKAGELAANVAQGQQGSGMEPHTDENGDTIVFTNGGPMKIPGKGGGKGKTPNPKKGSGEAAPPPPPVQNVQMSNQNNDPVFIINSGENLLDKSGKLKPLDGGEGAVVGAIKDLGKDIKQSNSLEGP